MPSSGSTSSDQFLQGPGEAGIISGWLRLAIFDNVKGHLNSPSLEAYLTATSYGDRILGVI